MAQEKFLKESINLINDDGLIKILKGSDTALIDNECIKSGINSAWLMKNAGKSISDFIKKFRQENTSVLNTEISAGNKSASHKKEPEALKPDVCFLCGMGNNGGDGIVCATDLLQSGFNVTLYFTGARQKLKGDSLFYLNELLKLKSEVKTVKKESCQKADIIFPENGNDRVFFEKLQQSLQRADFIVDAIFGTGLHGDIYGQSLEIINLVNKVKKTRKNLVIFAADIPSGVDSDNGKILGGAIKADFTITFVSKKTGHIIYPGSEYTGIIKVADIGVPRQILRNYESFFEATLKWVARKLPGRSSLSYKQSVGKLLVLAGSKGLTGAAAMTCQAAMRSGAGTVTLVCPESLNEIFEIKLTESMTFPVEQTETGSLHVNSFKSIYGLSAKHDALAIGPGLSRNPSTVMLVREVLKNIKIPTILDADGLRALVSPMEIDEEGELFNLDHVIITPHAGELCSILLREKINPDERIEVNAESSKKFDVVSVLKGSSSIITLQNITFINPTGDFALATAGTGDILTGIIGALLCQGMNRLDAAVCGAYIHGFASDLISKKTGKTSMIATDLLEGLQQVFLEIEKLKY